MAIRIFTISIHDSGQAENELNQFLRSHQILSIDKRWEAAGTSSFWTFCVDYLDPKATPGTPRFSSPGTSGKSRIDYRDLLKPEDFAIFAQLRDWRKDVAQQEAVPVYTIFTNEQLAQMVQTRTTTKAALEKIAGLGDARLEKYGNRILELLSKAWKPADETRGKSV